MKKSIALSVLVCMLMMLLAGCGSSAAPATEKPSEPAPAATEAPAAVAEEPAEALPMEGIHLKMAGYAGFYPFRYTDENGVIKGIDMDFYDEFAKRLGFTWEFVDVPFAEVIAGINGGLYDMAASMSYTAERDEMVDFSNYPYYIPHISILCQKGADLKSIADLADKKVCVALGTSQADWVMANVTCREVELLEGAATYTSIISGLNDAYISDSIELGNVAAENADTLESHVLPAEETVGGANPYRFLFNDGYEYLDLFDQALQDMFEDGTLDKIVTSWLGEEFAMDAATFTPIR